MRGTETLKGRLFYVPALLPRRSGKYLLQGRARIDVESYAVIKIEGRPTASFSFRVGEPLIIRQFEQVKGTWFMASSPTAFRTRLFGTSELTIDHGDRKRLPEPSALVDARNVVAIGA